MSRTPYITKPKTRKVYLPWEKELPEEDKTWFEHREMTEAEFQEFSNLTSTVRLGSKKKGKVEERAEMNMMLGTTRMFLLKLLIVDWNVIDEQGRDVEPTENNIKKLNPSIVKVWIDDIYDFNPILKGEDEEDEGDKVLTSDGELLPKG